MSECHELGRATRAVVRTCLPRALESVRRQGTARSTDPNLTVYRAISSTSLRRDIRDTRPRCERGCANPAQVNRC